ncbi:hypothetical protein ACFLSE_08900 [Bacteroidota bacterium]
MRNLKKLTLFLVLTTVFFSCEKNEGDNLVKKDLNIEEIQDVYVKDDVLVFKDWNVVYATLKELENKEVEFLDEWEKGLGFTSLRSIYNCFSIEEEEMVKELDDLYNEKNSLVTVELVAEKYSYLLEPYKNSIILIKQDDIEYYDMNIYYSHFAPVVNENGIISVGGEIYRYTNEDVRKIKDNDWSKLSELLNDNSPFVVFTEVLNNNTKRRDDPADPEDPFDPNDPPEDPCNHSVCYIPTANHWERAEEGVCWSGTGQKMIGYFSFVQHQYWYYDANCNKVQWTQTTYSYKIRSLRQAAWAGFTWQNYSICISVKYDSDFYLGNLYCGKMGWDWTYYPVAHTLTKTIYSSTTTSDHPRVSNAYVHAHPHMDEFSCASVSVYQ